MSVGVQCLLCRRVFCRQRLMEVEYAYCESCYGEEVQRLESILAAYQEKSNKQDMANYVHKYHHKRQLDFLSQSPPLQFDEGAKSLLSTKDVDSDKASVRNLLLWDVLLIPTDGLPVAAHKVVLAGRSPVFRAMFYSCPMKEAINNEVTIEEMPREALVAFVEFMYTANVAPKVMRRHAEVLFCAAHKYEVGFLRTLCEKALVSYIGPHNALAMLSLARRYTSQHLWAAVIQAAVEAHYDLPSTFSHYHQFVAHDPSLLLQLYHALLRVRHNNNPNCIVATNDLSSSSAFTTMSISSSSRKRRRRTPTT